MLIFLRRYWPVILIAVIFAVAVHQEWLNKTTPQPPLRAAAAQIPALAASPAVPLIEAQKPQGANSASQQKVIPPASGGQWDANDTIAVFTGLTFFVFVGQLIAMLRTNKHFRVTERAYVKMSHRPPGIFMFKINNSWWAIVTIRIKNFGNTPAAVTDAYITSEVIPNGQNLPNVPVYTEYGERERVTAFLVANDEFNHRAQFGLTPAQYNAVMAGEAELTILGYVDYRDKFGDRHRGTYARTYDPTIDNRDSYASEEDFAGRNNLTIVSAPLYNDDRPRVHGEGVDWD